MHMEASESEPTIPFPVDTNLSLVGDGFAPFPAGRYRFGWSLDFPSHRRRLGVRRTGCGARRATCIRPGGDCGAPRSSKRPALAWRAPRFPETARPCRCTPVDRFTRGCGPHPGYFAGNEVLCSRSFPSRPAMQRRRSAFGCAGTPRNCAQHRSTMGPHRLPIAGHHNRLAKRRTVVAASRAYAMKEPIVSVVMSVFNGDSLLRDTLDSILAQEGIEFELVVVDDGSTDKTAAILEEAARNDQRVRVLRQQNQGLTRALIAGCRAARGVVIARHDCGDRSSSLRLKRQFELISSAGDIVLVSCKTLYVGPEREPLYTLTADGEAVRQ